MNIPKQQYIPKFRVLSVKRVMARQMVGAIMKELTT